MRPGAGDDHMKMRHFAARIARGVRVRRGRRRHAQQATPAAPPRAEGAVSAAGRSGRPRRGTRADGAAADQLAVAAAAGRTDRPGHGHPASDSARRHQGSQPAVEHGVSARRRHPRDRAAGRLRIVRNGVLDPTPVAGLPQVQAAGLAGLMDIALHPQFAENKLVYFTYHKPQAPGPGGLAAGPRAGAGRLRRLASSRSRGRAGTARRSSRRRTSSRRSRRETRRGLRSARTAWST